MARQAQQRHLGSGIGIKYEGVPGLSPVSLPLLDPAQQVVAHGINFRFPAGLKGQGYYSDVKNMRLLDGLLHTRDAFVDVSTDTDTIVGLVKFVDGRNVSKLIRATPDGLDGWDGTAWSAIPSDVTFTGGALDFFTFTTFDDALIFSNGIDGLCKYSFSDGKITLIANGPSCKHLTTFAGRIIASYTFEASYNPQRIAWCAKYNLTEWEDSGLGAGFEDLVNVPGGQIDKQFGVWPISDSTALVVRGRSIWLMQETGIVTTPFSFSRRFAGLGTDSPYSVAAMPDGIVIVARDDIYVVTSANKQRIGTLVFDQIMADASDPATIRGAFDEQKQEYVLTAGAYVYKYSFLSPGWVRHPTPAALKLVAYSQSAISARTISDLSALSTTISGLSGIADTIIELSGTTEDGLEGMLYAGNTVVKEDSSTHQDSVESTVGNIPILLQSDEIFASQPQYETQILELRLWYESTVAGQVLTFEYSTDGGTTWSTYSTKTTAVTTHPTLLRCYKTLTSQRLMVRVRTTAQGYVKLSRWTLELVQQRGIQGNV